MQRARRNSSFLVGWDQVGSFPRTSSRCLCRLEEISLWNWRQYLSLSTTFADGVPETLLRGGSRRKIGGDRFAMVDKRYRATSRTGQAARCRLYLARPSCWRSRQQGALIQGGKAATTSGDCELLASVKYPDLGEMCLPKCCRNLGPLDSLLGNRPRFGFAIRSPGQTKQLCLETSKRRLAAGAAAGAVAAAVAVAFIRS